MSLENLKLEFFCYPFISQECYSCHRLSKTVLTQEFLLLKAENRTLLIYTHSPFRSDLMSYNLIHFHKFEENQLNYVCKHYFLDTTARNNPHLDN